MHPYIIAEIPGLELENDYDNTVVPALKQEEEPIKDMAKWAEDVGNNFDHGNIVHKTREHIKVVDEIIEKYSGSEYDFYEDGDYTPRMVKIEDSDSRDDRSEVDRDKNQDDVLIENIY